MVFLSQKCIFSLVTQDNSEVVVPADFVDQSEMLSNYAKTQPQENGAEEEQQAKFVMTDKAPFTNKFHLEMIFEFLRLYKREQPHETPEEGASDVRLGKGESNSEEPNFESTMPEWALDLFSKQSKNDLFLTMNSANYFGIGSFVTFSAAFVCFQIMKKGAEEAAEYLNLELDPNSAEEMRKIMGEMGEAREEQAKQEKAKEKKEKDEARRRAEAEARAAAELENEKEGE
uniref:Uncharacterized protein n=1 Tax=Globodera rostochiensis TaxID=31243 RepID=A0A914IAP6_GLORO